MIQRLYHLQNFLRFVKRTVVFGERIAVFHKVGVRRVDKSLLAAVSTESLCFVMLIQSKVLIVGSIFGARNSFELFHLVRIDVSIKKVEIAPNKVYVGRILRSPVIKLLYCL